MKIIVTVLIILFSTLIKAELAEGWPTLRGDNQRSGVIFVSADAIKELSALPKILWEVNTSPGYDPSPILYKPKSGPNILISAHSLIDSSTLVTRDATTGKVIQTTKLTGWLDPFGPTGAVLQDGSVIVTHRSGVNHVGNDGKLKWVYVVDDELGPPIVTKSGVVVVGRALCGGIFALDLATGIPKWAIQLQTSGFCSNPNLSLDEKTLWVTTSNLDATSFWFSIDVETGKYQREGNFPDIGNPEIGFEMYNTISGQPDATLYMTYLEGDPSCWPYCDPKPIIVQLNSNTGEQIPGIVLEPNTIGGFLLEISISTYNGLLYIVNCEGDVICLDPSVQTTGKTLWTTHCSFVGYNASAFSLAAPIIAVAEDKTGGVVIVGFEDKMCAVDMTDGHLLWILSLNGKYLNQQPAISPDGIIYAPLRNKDGNWITAF